MFALRHVTLFDQAGAEVWEDTEGQCGSPDLETLVTSQSRATAALQIRLPRKPFPPNTSSFFLAAAVVAIARFRVDEDSESEKSGVRRGVAEKVPDEQHKRASERLKV